MIELFFLSFFVVLSELIKIEFKARNSFATHQQNKKKEIYLARFNEVVIQVMSFANELSLTGDHQDRIMSNWTDILPSLINRSTTTAPTTTSSQMNITFGPYCQSHNDTVLSRVIFSILIVVFIVGFLVNTLAVTVILASRSLRRQWTNLFVASLNICDIGVILFVVPLRIDNVLHDGFCFDIHVCRLFNIADSIFHSCSISHLFVMAIERFIAVRLPFVYQRYFNHNTTIKIICATWLYSIGWGVAGSLKWNPQNGAIQSSSFIDENFKRTCLVDNTYGMMAIVFVIYIIPLIIMAVLYALILKTALEQQKLISSLAPSYLRQDDHATQKRKQEVSASKTVAVIYGAFALCWLPNFIIIIIVQLCQECITPFQQAHPDLALVTFTIFIVLLPAIHSCLNPFIYIIFHRRFRKAFKILLQGKFKTLTEHSLRRNSAKSTGSSPKTIEMTIKGS